MKSADMKFGGYTTEMKFGGFTTDTKFGGYTTDLGMSNCLGVPLGMPKKKQVQSPVSDWTKEMNEVI